MNHLHPIDTEQHFELFKLLYAESLQWTTSSCHVSVINYETVLLDPSSVWRVYVKDDEVLGIAGFHSINMIDRSAEPLVGIIPAARKNGHGLAMSLELREFGFEDLNLRRIYSTVLSDSPSRAILEKTGFTHEATLQKARFRDGEYEDVLVYRLLREEYESCLHQ